jgi:dihydroxyacetone kinase
MLDALIPAAEAIDRVALAGGTMAAALAAAADAAEAGAEATRTMSAGAGRASYVPQETVAAVPDPGAKGVAFWLRALAMSAGGGQKDDDKTPPSVTAAVAQLLASAARGQAELS